MEKFKLVFVLTQGNALSSTQGFISKPIEKAYVLLQDGTRNDLNRLPFEIACFYVTITRNFECFQYFNFFFKKKNEKQRLFSKNCSIVFPLNVLRLKTQHFHTKHPYQKAMLRQIE